MKQYQEEHHVKIDIVSIRRIDKGNKRPKFAIALKNQWKTFINKVTTSPKNSDGGYIVKNGWGQLSFGKIKEV